MTAKLIAWTQVNDEAIDGYRGWTTDATGIEKLIEFAGRLCYMSWKKPNPLTATIAGYLGNIRSQRHFSVFEHGTATFLFEGVSRSLTHELIRHRHFSYSELSQRFVNMNDPDFVVPPALEFAWRGELISEIAACQEETIDAYAKIVDFLVGKGLERKPAREAARAVMMNCVATKIVVTGNMRAWRHFINIRGSEHADAEIRAVAVEVALALSDLCPNLFNDLCFYEVDGQTCVRLEEVENS